LRSWAIEGDAQSILAGINPVILEAPKVFALHIKGGQMFQSAKKIMAYLPVKLEAAGGLAQSEACGRVENALSNMNA
jgi:hypothetical protein